MLTVVLHVCTRACVSSLSIAAQAGDDVHRLSFLDVVVRERTAVLKLLACKDEALLVGRDALLVLKLLLPICQNHLILIHHLFCFDARA